MSINVLHKYMAMAIRCSSLLGGRMVNASLPKESGFQLSTTRRLVKESRSS